MWWRNFKREDFSALHLQHEDIDLRWKDEIEIEENNLLTTYNLIEAMSNNVTIEVIQEGSNHLDFKVVLKEYKNI